MSDIQQLLSDEQAFEAAVRGDILEIEPVAGGDPFSAQFRARVREGQALQAEGGTVPLDWANRFLRRRRDRIFERNIRDATKPRIVAIGDSWFAYPFGSDLMEWFEDQFALKTFAVAGDEIARMVRDRDYRDAIRTVDPHFFMVSGGGNDLLGIAANGERNLKRMVIRYDPAAADWLTPACRTALAWVVAQFEALHADITALGFTGAMVVHGYDYASPPAEGPWISHPLEEMGYQTDAAQLEAIVRLVDAFDAEIAAWAATKANVIHARCNGRNGRGPRWWFNEIHPTVNGYRYRLLSSFRTPMDAYLRAGVVDKAA